MSSTTVMKVTLKTKYNSHEVRIPFDLENEHVPEEILSKLEPEMTYESVMEQVKEKARKRNIEIPDEIAKTMVKLTLTTAYGVAKVEEEYEDIYPKKSS